VAKYYLALKLADAFKFSLRSEFDGDEFGNTVANAMRQVIPNATDPLRASNRRKLTWVLNGTRWLRTPDNFQVIRKYERPASNNSEKGPQLLPSTLGSDSLRATRGRIADRARPP